MPRWVETQTGDAGREHSAGRSSSGRCHPRRGKNNRFDRKCLGMTLPSLSLSTIWHRSVNIIERAGLFHDTIPIV